MTTTAETVDEIRAAHRKRRFAIKIQQKLDRALESFVRRNATEWSPDLSEAERTKINAEVKNIIKQTREGNSVLLAEAISTSDLARVPADQLRNANEKLMEKLAETLPIWPWCESIRGIGTLGLATIIAECGDLSNYSNVAKIWKRLGYAPFEGYAGSTWKRETWRPRALTKDEWIANPFSGERYALMAQISLWLRNAQWIGKAKTKDGTGKPNGFYGEVYAKRRARTAIMHPNWSDGHADKDALRVMFKKFLLDLWVEWNRLARSERPANLALKSKTDMPDASIPKSVAIEPLKSIRSMRPQRSAKGILKPKEGVPSASIPKSVANVQLKSSVQVRPLRSAKLRVKSGLPLPDASIQESVASHSLKSRHRMRPKRSAISGMKSSKSMPGATYEGNHD